MAKKPAKASAGRSVDKSDAIDKESKLNDGEMSVIERWIEEIETAKLSFGAYWDTCDKIAKKYKAAEDDSSQLPSSMRGRKYNVLWSVTQTLQPLVYSQPPVPYISRENMDRDAVARDATLILTRANKEELQGNELHEALIEARDDYLLGSRGIVWPKYTPYMKLRESDDKTYLTDATCCPEGVSVKEDEHGQYYHATYEEKVYEEVDWEHVRHRDFLHGAAAKWRHVPWVGRMVPMTRKELIKRFGKDIGKEIPLTLDTKKKKSTEEKTGDSSKGLFAKGEVWEIWFRADRKVMWVCPQFKDSFLDEQDDFLELEDFFPCPKPAFGTKTNDSLIPTPDFMLWQDVAIELDEVTWRIKLLTEALRVVGIYDKTLGDVMARITKQTADNDMIGVDGWAQLAEKGGLKGAMEFLPIEQVAAVLDKLYMARTRLIAELYDITGISDIVRGASDPRETAKAQQIKGNFANKRLKARQDEMLRMARDALEIQSQIMCKHYSPETLEMVSAADQVILDPVTQNYDRNRFGAAVMLLKNSSLRRFRMKVDEKTLAMPDIQDDQQQRVQFVQGVSQLLTASTSMIQVAPAAGPLLGQLLLFATRGFPMAASMEADMESALQKLLQTPLPQEPQDQKAAGKSPQELQIEAQKNEQKARVENGHLELEKLKAQWDQAFQKMTLDWEKAYKSQELQLTAKRDEYAHTVAMYQLQSQQRQHQDKISLDAQQHQADVGLQAQQMATDTAQVEKDRQFAQQQHQDGVHMEHQQHQDQLGMQARQHQDQMGFQHKQHQDQIGMESQQHNDEMKQQHTQNKFAAAQHKDSIAVERQKAKAQAAFKGSKPRAHV